MEKLYCSKQGRSSSCTGKQLQLKTRKGTWFIPLNLMNGGTIEWHSQNNLINCHYLSLSALGREMYFIQRMKWERCCATMLCGVTRIISRIKWLVTFSFDRERRPFERGLCHQCLWCKFFDECVGDQEWIEAQLEDEKLHPDYYTNGEGYYQQKK